MVALVESAYRGQASREGWTTEADLLDGQRTDAAAVAEAVGRPDGTVLVATSGASIVGCCQLVGGPGAAARFGMFAVAPRLQGRSIGDALLAEAERVSRAAGAGALRMEVLARGPSCSPGTKGAATPRPARRPPSPTATSASGSPAATTFTSSCSRRTSALEGLRVSRPW